jgi:pyruvate dehydrogenase E1 component beta subunit
VRQTRNLDLAETGFLQRALKMIGQGADVTVLSYGTMVFVSLAAATESGIDAEVIDLRTIRQMDHETIIESVKKTNRIVCAEEGWGPMGVGAEVVARVIEHAFDYLDAPPTRVHQEDVPLPYAANLEKAALIDAARCRSGSKRILGRPIQYLFSARGSCQFPRVLGSAK